MSDSKDYIIREYENGSVNISTEVIAVISAVAASEVEGVKSPAVTGKDAKSKKNLSKYVKIEADENNVSIEINMIVSYGFAINEVSAQVQDKVANAVESVTGLKISEINVNVRGISFSKK